jgi:penicillin-binding protein 1C
LHSLKRLNQDLTFRFKLSLIVLLALVGGALTYVLIPKPDLLNYQSYSKAIFDRNDNLLRISLAQDERYRLYTPLKDISQYLQQATVLYEDQNYYTHSGVDYVALMRAFWQTYVLQERRIGASTIVMQVARLRWNIPSNTISGKMQQIFRALQLSKHYSKQELLEAYLNLAPYGGNIEGIGAASLIYFDKPASKLSLVEALTLAVVPQNPSKRNPSKPSGMRAIAPAKQRLLARWKETYPEHSDLSTLFELPLKVRSPKDLPFKAPHYVEYLIAQQSQTYMQGLSRSSSSATSTSLLANQQIKGTIDITLQSRLEDVLRAYVSQNRGKGFNNASALLLNSKTMQIEAMIGSADFHDETIHGQVNGTLAKRSPGSTLKPFVYGLAMDAGLIHPMTMLKDLPKKYAGFAPENFGKGFVGPISAQDALIRSRNVPAVDLQSQLLKLKEAEKANSKKTQTFYQFLQNAGISDLKDADFYGLALALGGGEVSMLELVELYAMISNLGVHRGAVSTYWVSAKEGAKELENTQQLLSPEAAFLIFDMLTKNAKPNSISYASTAPARINEKTVAWKTGTSWAFRDAWAIGIYGDYVLATWIGNFNGEGNNAFIGRTATGPLLFRLFDVVSLNIENTSSGSHSDNKLASELAPESSPSFIDELAFDSTALGVSPFNLNQLQKLNLKWVDICKATGDLFEVGCPDKGKTLFIPGVSPIKSANIYRTVWIDKETGLRRCDNNAAQSTKKVFAFWPSDFQLLFEKAGVYYEKPPALMPSCNIDKVATVGEKPQIKSPQSGLSYVLEDNHNSTVTIPLQANADAEVEHLYWFANGQFIGSTNLKAKLTTGYAAGPLLWQAKPGAYEVQVSDDFGRSSVISVQVQAVK